MAVASDVDAAELRRRVTSPAGTTEAAIKSFQANGFEAIVEQALGAAATAPPNWPNNWSLISLSKE
jgi:pyrroline-5-carboxylate reductase